MSGLPTLDEKLFGPVAMQLADGAARSVERIMAQHADSFKWLMASLFALNGGGILVLKDAKLTGFATFVAAMAFYVGIVTALAVAKAGQVSAGAAADPMSKLHVFWVVSAQRGYPDEEELKSIQEELANALKKSRVAPILGWVSLAAFTVGLLALLLGRA